MKVSVEIYFLRFAFPCAHISVERGRLSARRYNRLRKIAIDGRLPEDMARKDFRREVEAVFEPAFRRIKVMMAESGMKGTVWKREVFEKYFLEDHNRLIDAGTEDYSKAPKVLRELCKVKKGRVISDRAEKSEKGNWFVQVEFEDGGKRTVIADFLGKRALGLRKRDAVYVHHGYVVF